MRSENAMVRHLSTAYIAGFFDGEGGITISGSLKRSSGVNHVVWTRRVYIGNTEISVLKAIQNKLGGKLRPWHHRAGCKPYFSLDFHSNASVRFLRSLSPYLVLKKSAHYFTYLSRTLFSVRVCILSRRLCSI